jgi:micrococcal nuclease
MKRPFLLLLTLFTLTLPFFTPLQATAKEGPFKVTRVVDGDTVEVLYNGKKEKVRLIGVDTPETVHPTKPVEYYGKEASAYTKQLLTGQSVDLEYDQTTRDKYGRLLAYLYRASDGLFVNLEIIKGGYGHAYTVFPFAKMDQFRQAEVEARSAGKGLWAQGSRDQGHDHKEATAKQDGDGSQIVYVTKSGKKYHADGCRSLSKSRIEISLEEASAKYGPCSICSPPVMAKGDTDQSKEETKEQPKSKPTGGRCQATTKKGTQCKRKAKTGSDYCWQHGG